MRVGEAAGELYGYGIGRVEAFIKAQAPPERGLGKRLKRLNRANLSAQRVWE